MNSNWSVEVRAILRKEFRTELRSKTGLVTASLFGFATVVTVSLALFNQNPNVRPVPDIASALVWIILLFSTLLTLPRSFLLEEEQGTADLLRLTARPHAIFWGKVIFNSLQTLMTGAFISVVFLGLTGVSVAVPWLYAVSLIGGGISLAGAVTLCGAIASHAANRAAVAGAIAIPLLLPLLQWGVTGMRAAFGVGLVGGGTVAAVGLVAYGVLTLLLGPWIYAAIWKT